MNTKTKLHDSLAMHLQDGGPLGRMIAHPLLYAIAYRPELNAEYNLQFLNKQAAAKKALQECNWHTNIFLHERPYRLHALMSLCVVLDMNNRRDECQSMLNEMLPSVYVDAEGTHTNAEIWATLFARFTGERNLDQLPDGTFQIYRGTQGCDQPEDGGFSWSLDEDRAQFFASRFGPDGLVQVKTVTRADVVFYTDDRGEKDCLHFS